jgi:dUTP pyrophosphatase
MHWPELKLPPINLWNFKMIDTSEIIDTMPPYKEYIPIRYTLTDHANALKESIGFDCTPTYATKGSAALDVRACIDKEIVIFAGEQELIPLGFKTSIPEGAVGLLLPRSGLGFKGLILGNGTGVIDSDYREEWKAIIWNRTGEDNICIKPGDRIAQVIFTNAFRVTLIESEELDSTDRKGGFGHTGER